MSLIYENLGKQVKRYRKEKKLSTSELAERLEISTGLLNNIENYRHDVFKLQLLNKIIDELELSPNELIYLPSKNGAAIKPVTLQNNELTDLCNKHLQAIIDSYITTIQHYSYSKESIEKVSWLLQQTLSTLTQLNISQIKIPS